MLLYMLLQKGIIVMLDLATHTLKATHPKNYPTGLAISENDNDIIVAFQCIKTIFKMNVIETPVKTEAITLFDEDSYYENGNDDDNKDDLANTACIFYDVTVKWTARSEKLFGNI